MDHVVLKTEEFEAYGIECKLVGGHMSINGYARIPEDNPLCRAPRHEIEPLIRVRGGITYGPDSEGWIGFDTNHAWDVWTQEEFESFGLHWSTHNQTVFKIVPEYHDDFVAWTVDRLREETVYLAYQVSIMPLPQCSIWETWSDEPLRSWD